MTTGMACIAREGVRLAEPIPGLDTQYRLRKTRKMTNNTPSGLSPLWLAGLALALSVFLTTAIPVVLSVAEIDSKAWIGFSGSVIGGAIALFGLYVASRNVGRQLQLTTLMREEDRIEKELPGLRDAEERIRALCEAFGAETSPTQIYNLLHANHIGEKGTDLEAEVVALLPRTDDRTRRDIRDSLFAVNVAAIRGTLADHIKRANDDKFFNITAYAPDTHQAIKDDRDKSIKDLNQLTEDVRSKVKVLAEVQRRIADKVARMERAAPRIRAALESRLNV